MASGSGTLTESASHWALVRLIASVTDSTTRTARRSVTGSVFQTGCVSRCSWPSASQTLTGSALQTESTTVTESWWVSVFVSGYPSESGMELRAGSTTATATRSAPGSRSCCVWLLGLMLESERGRETGSASPSQLAIGWERAKKTLTEMVWVTGPQRETLQEVSQVDKGRHKTARKRACPFSEGWLNIKVQV